MTVIVSAPAKVHLMGEHTVVYGKPALLTAIDKRLYIRLTKTKARKIEIVTKEKDYLLKEAINLIKKVYQLENISGFRLEVSSSIPVGRGLGSSAALAVATIGALQRFFKKVWHPQKINELAYQVEKKQHGNPSGGDNSVVTFGGFLWFRKEFEFLKSIWQLPIKPAGSLARKFMLIDSGKAKETTKQMVSLVQRKVESQKSKMEKIFNDQEKLTKELVLALKEGRQKQIMKIIRLGERNLEKLGVVGKKAISMIKDIESKGGVAKISGAGGIKDGSGMLLCFHPQPTVLVDLAKQKRWEMMQIKLGEEGVRSEYNSVYSR